MLPWASVAVNVRVNRCSPCATSRAKSSEASTVTAVQLSVATAISKGMTSSHDKVRSSGTDTKAGGVVSETATVWGVEAAFPHASTAV